MNQKPPTLSRGEIQQLRDGGRPIPEPDRMIRTIIAQFCGIEDQAKALLHWQAACEDAVKEAEKLQGELDAALAELHALRAEKK